MTIMPSQNVQYLMNYTEIVQQILDKQYPDKQATKVIAMSTLNLKFLPPRARTIFESYSQVTTLSLVNCDLRKLENFPVLPCLRELDLSGNSLQGTLNYLMPLKSLVYLDISRNIISQIEVLQPLKRFPKLEVYLLKNPFTCTRDWKFKIKSLYLKTLSSPKPLLPHPSDGVKVEPQVAVKQEERQQRRKGRKEILHAKLQSMRARFQRNKQVRANPPRSPSPQRTNRVQLLQNNSPNYIRREQAQPQQESDSSESHGLSDISRGQAIEGVEDYSGPEVNLWRMAEDNREMVEMEVAYDDLEGDSEQGQDEEQDEDEENIEDAYQFE